MIKPCPFCGAPGNSGWYLDPVGGPTIARVGCSAACCPSMWEAADDDSLAAVDKALADTIKRWNKRAPVYVVTDDADAVKLQRAYADKKDAEENQDYNETLELDIV